MGQVFVKDVKKNKKMFIPHIHTCNIMAANDLMSQGARALAAIVLTYSPIFRHQHQKDSSWSICEQWRTNVLTMYVTLMTEIIK